MNTLKKYYEKKLNQESKEKKNDALIFEKSKTINAFAKELFENAYEIKLDLSSIKLMEEQTKEAIKKGEELILNATFAYKEHFIIIDVLQKVDNLWNVYEVRLAGTLYTAHKIPRIKEKYLNDLCAIYLALEDKLDLGEVFILHPNNEFVRQGDIKASELLKTENLSEKVKEKKEEISQQLKKLEEHLQNNDKINAAFSLYKLFSFDFKEYFKTQVENNIICDLYRIENTEILDFYNNHIKTFADIPSTYKLNKTQEIQLKVEKEGKPHINKEIIDNFVNEVKFPINFFDFETYSQAIPLFDGQKVYERIPFQYSLHILYEDGRLEHKEFLGDFNKDPRDDLIKQLLENITLDGSIIVYHKSFESGVFKELANFCTQRSEELLALDKRIIDLKEPFSKGGYYQNEFNGSFSIKSVLPALFPNDDELDYKKLGLVQNGSDAMNIFPNLPLLKDKTMIEQVQNDLLAYCKLDTLAMVKLWEKLIKIVNE